MCVGLSVGELAGGGSCRLLGASCGAVKKGGGVTSSAVRAKPGVVRTCAGHGREAFLGDILFRPFLFCTFPFRPHDKGDFQKVAFRPFSVFIVFTSYFFTFKIIQ